jgi:hypothetical protein
MKSVDLKSLVIGGLLVLLVLYALGAAPRLRPEDFGRFTIDTTVESAVILDTATGQAWAFEMPRGLVSSYTPPEVFFGSKIAGSAHPSEPNTSKP